MFDYKKLFDSYCSENHLDLQLCFHMPAGYETAYGTFDAETKTVFINAELLKKAPDYEKAFYLFHEFRHASQHLNPGQFSKAVIRSTQYVIMYDGNCYKMDGGKYLECRLDGSEESFTDLYLGQPNEADANAYAYKQVRRLYGNSDDLRKLYEFWSPKQPVSAESYSSVYDLIDSKTEADCDQASTIC